MKIMFNFMPTSRPWPLLPLSLFLAIRPAAALDRFEIQVYQNDLNRPGQLGLELHTNYTPRGRSNADYPGEVPPDRVGRLTLEPALGITPWLELGAYFQMMVSPDSQFRYGGVKLRAKLVAPVPGPFFYGVNVEIGRVPRAVEEEGWANEFRPILGYYNGRVLVDINPIVGYALSGPEAFRPDFEPAAKVAVNSQHGFSLGVEYYAGLGQFQRGLLPGREQEHLLYAAFDLTPPAGRDDEGDEFEFNLAVGRSLQDDTWIVKAIFGRAF